MSEFQNNQPQDNSSNDYWGGWLSVAKTQAAQFAARAKEIADTASKVAQEQATLIARQAQEIRENYDLDAATSILMNTVGGPVQAPTAPRDPNNIRLTKSDLSQLDMIYITENVIGMAFPRDLSQPRRQSAAADEQMGDGNDINVVAAYLKQRHQGKFMIWNISEEAYDYSKFSDQVLEYKFPGHPAPPLGLLFKICTSIESWLDADDTNVAVVHCLTGKGRTATLMACVLTWLGEFESPMQALQYVADRRSTIVEHLTIPSQRRYIQYFSNMLDGVKPNSEPLYLRRIIVNSIPIFGYLDENDDSTRGCCPYVQLFKNGKLIASAASTMEKGNLEEDSSSSSSLKLRWVNAREGNATFRLDMIVQGDVLLRCRHASMSGARVSMFRAAFHTGYISGGVLRLTKAQLDGSPSDPRYPDDFFIDLIFAPINQAPNIPSGDIEDAGGLADILGEAGGQDKYESGLHKDAKFWEAVTARKNKSKKRRSRKFESNSQDPFSIVEDSKFLQEQEASEEIAFKINSKFASNQSTNSYNDDMELIKQLAQAEGDSQDDISVKSGAVPSTKSSQPITPASNVAKGELQTLEELERELGLVDLQLFSNEKSNPSASQSTNIKSESVTVVENEAGSTAEDDNLDELERYLQSLSSQN
jgi:hypothetical protein